MIRGEPGIGKTSLVHEALARGAERGFSTLSGRAAEFEQDLPFAVLVDALERRVSSDDVERLAQAAGWRPGPLQQVLPFLGGSTAAPPTGHERHHVLRALHALLEALAAEQPLILALDDLHWADAASVDLLCRLLHRGIAHPSLLVLALRLGRVEPRLRTALWEAERHGIVSSIELQALSKPESEQLLDGVDDHALRELIYRQSGGNPLYLEQLASARARLGRVPGDDPGAPEAGVPGPVAAAIRAEADALSAPARALIDGAAVAGDPFEHALAAHAAGIDSGAALGALDELVDSGLVRPTEAPGRFRFRHPIVRWGVYQAAGAGWRLGAHQRVAAVLYARGTPASARAAHVERSAEPGDLDAVAVLTAAGDETSGHAPVSAARWFEAASRLLPADERHRVRRLHLAGRRATALGSAGRVEEGLEALGEFLALSPKEPSELRHRAAVFAAIFYELVGRQDQARRILLDELSRLPDQFGADAGDLKRELAFTAFFDADWEAMAAGARDALACAGEGMVRVGALAALALAEFGRHRLDAVQAAVADAVARFDALSDAEVAAHHPGIAGWLGWAEVCAERADDAIRHLERGMALSRRGTQRPQAVGLLFVQSQALALTGRVEELRAAAEAATEASLLSSSNLLLSWASTARSQSDLLAGDLHDAVRFGERGAAASAAARSPLSGIARVQLAEALLEAGEAERCRAELTGADGQPDLPPFPLYEARCLELLARAALAVGDIERAASLTADAERSAGRMALMLPRAHAGRARAALLLRGGEPDAAASTALEAAEAARVAHAPIDAARGRILAGKAHAVAGRRPAAIRELEAAHAELTRRHATLHADEAARELRRLGRAIARRAGEDAGTLGLTPRELDVIRLVAAGRTNREIAGEMVLSVRTVDRHVSRIFEKLGVSSRMAAASSFERALRPRAPAPSSHGDGLDAGGQRGDDLPPGPLA